MSTSRKAAGGLMTTLGVVMSLVTFRWDAAKNNAAWLFYCALGVLCIGVLLIIIPYVISTVATVRIWFHHIRQYDAVQKAKTTAETERDDALSQIAILDAARIAAEEHIETLEPIANTAARWQERARDELDRGYARAIGEVLAGESGATFNSPSVVLNNGRLLLTAVPRHDSDLAPIGALFRVVHTPSETTAMWLLCEGSTTSGRASRFVPDRYGDLSEEHLRSYAEPGAVWPADYDIMAPNIEEILRKE